MSVALNNTKRFKINVTLQDFAKTLGGGESRIAGEGARQVGVTGMMRDHLHGFDESNLQGKRRLAVSWLLTISQIGVNVYSVHFTTTI